MAEYSRYALEKRDLPMPSGLDMGLNAVALSGIITGKIGLPSIYS